MLDPNQMQLTPDGDDLAAIVARLAAMDGDDPVAIMRAAVNLFAGRIAMVSSFGAESAVLLHMLSTIDKSVPVLFVDTGRHFFETRRYRTDLAEKLGLTQVIDVRPKPAEVAAIDADETLFESDPDACCGIRKVTPLNDALNDYAAWFSGRKRFQGEGRAAVPLSELDDGRVKVDPLADWPRERLIAYFEQHDLPIHPLVPLGYPSIGCEPCTRPAANLDDLRSGRWVGFGKTECGIHSAKRKQPGAK